MGNIVLNTVLLWQNLLHVHQIICHWKQAFWKQMMESKTREGWLSDTNESKIKPFFFFFFIIFSSEDRVTPLKHDFLLKENQVKS